jgi:hypothetical protein
LASPLFLIIVSESFVELVFLVLALSSCLQNGFSLIILPLGKEVSVLPFPFAFFMAEPVLIPVGGCRGLETCSSLGVESSLLGASGDFEGLLLLHQRDVNNVVHSEDDVMQS